MSTRFLEAVCIVLAAGGAIGMSDAARATMITEQKDSADFPTATQYDGADLLGSDWSTFGSPNGTAEGTLLRFSPASGDNCYQWGSSLSDSLGWTVEISYQITQPETSGNGVFGLIAADGTYGQYKGMDFAWNDIVYWYSQVLVTGDFTDNFHTLRIAEPAAGGTGDVHVWVDGQLASNTLTGLDYALSRLFVGDLGSGYVNGEALIEYVRVDATGAFAPPVPEPSSLVLLVLGLVAVAGRRWRKRK